MRTKLILAFGIAALVISLGMVAWRALPHPYLIYEDQTGFHPRTLTVPEGSRVIFISVRGKYFWPASDFHPTHTLHPEFDPKEPIAPHSSWSHVFTAAGTFPFHDHLAAYYMGVIYVTDANGTIVDDCMRGGKMACWQTQLFAALANGGPNAAYDLVAKLYDQDPDFAQSCHYLSHNLGLATYQFYQKDPSVLLSPKAVACAAGFYHGFMEGYLGATGDIAGAGKICDTIGQKIGDQAPDARLQCYHGIGHGSIETQVATTGEFDSLNAAVQAALGNCETASPGTDERYRCASGVYNAIANFYIAGEYGLSVKTSDPFALCGRAADTYKEACYGNMNSVALWEGKNDLAAALPYVTHLPETAYRPRAVFYLSNLDALQYVGTTTSFGPAVAACRSAGLFRLDCIDGFAHGLLEHGAPGQQYVRALQFCGIGGLATDERAACYRSTLGQLGGWYPKEEAARICASVPAEQRQYCAPVQSTP